MTIVLGKDTQRAHRSKRRQSVGGDYSKTDRSQGGCDGRNKMIQGRGSALKPMEAVQPTAP